MQKDNNFQNNFKNKEEFCKIYSVFEKIDEGGHAKVFKVQNSVKQEFAAKFIEASKILLIY